MKKFSSILLALLLAFGLVSCDNPVDTSSVASYSSENESSETALTSSADSDVTSDTSSDESSAPAEPTFDVETDLLPLFDGVDDENQAKAAEFLNFVAEKCGIDNLADMAQEIAENGYNDNLWYEYTGNTLHFLRSLYLDDDSLPNVRYMSSGTRGSEKTTVMTFGGDVCFGDNYYPMQHLKSTENGLYDCFAPEWIEIMRNADIAMLNNEFTISDRGEPMPKKLYTFRAETGHTSLYNELGVDFVTLANNHAFDYGEIAFFDTLDTLTKYGVDYAGGGRNAEEAQRPFYYLVDGRKIGFVSATRAEKYILTPEATEDSAGVFRCYDPERLIEVITETKHNCDYVVLFVHWGTEYSAVLEKAQTDTSHKYIDAGADLIIGSHAHQLQGIEFYNDKAIFYNLGNFWFNGKKIETGLVQLELAPSGDAEYYFLPGLQYHCETSYELGTELGREIMDRIASYEEGIVIEDDGRVTSG